MKILSCNELCELDFDFVEATIKASIQPGHFETEKRAAGWTDYPNGAQGQTSELTGYVKYRSKCNVVLSIHWIANGKIGGTFADLYKFCEPKLYYSEAIDTPSWEVDGANIDSECDYDDFCTVDNFIDKIGWEKHARDLFPEMGFVDLDMSDIEEESTMKYLYKLENHEGPTVRFNGVLIWALECAAYWGKREYSLYITTQSNKLIVSDKRLERCGYGDYYSVHVFNSMVSLITSDYSWIIEEIEDGLDF